MTTVETPPEAVLFRKIAEVMGEVGYLQKRGVNNFQNYKYATEADIVEAVREKLAERHVALIPGIAAITERPYQTSGGKSSVVTTAQMSFTFVCGETGAMFRTEWAGQGDDPADKGLYSAMTGALKYFLMKTFLIPTGDDPEANTQTDERAQHRTNGEPARQGTPGRKAQGVTASPAQLKFVKSLVTKSKASREQLHAILERSGFDGVVIEEGWLEKLTGGKQGSASALIDWLQSRPLPDLEHPSDVPSDTSEFEPSADEVAEARKLADETFGVGTA